MIKDYLNSETIRLKVDAKDRKEAIEVAAECLIRQNKIKPAYVDKIFQAIDKYGPYIVLIPGIALAHAEPGPEVLEECISMITLRKPVVFGHAVNDPVQTVFVLASNSKTKHMKVLMDISKILMEDSFIQMLNNCTDVAELISYLERKEEKL